MKFKQLVAICLSLIIISSTSVGVAANSTYSTKENTIITGDFDGSGVVSAKDSIYLLYYTLYGESEYPLNLFANVNGDGYINSDDAVYLLYNVLFGDVEYPLYDIGKPDEFAVTFTDTDGRVLKAESVEYGGSATQPELPLKKGYDFAGWDKDFDLVKSHITLTAQYKTAENQIYIDYITNESGTVTAVFSVNGNVNIAALELQLGLEMTNTTYSDYTILVDGFADANYIGGVFYFSFMSADSLTNPCELFSITFDGSENVNIFFNLIDSVVSDDTFTEITEANLVCTSFNG